MSVIELGIDREMQRHEAPLSTASAPPKNARVTASL